MIFKPCLHHKRWPKKKQMSKKVVAQQYFLFFGWNSTQTFFSLRCRMPGSNNSCSCTGGTPSRCGQSEWLNPEEDQTKMSAPVRELMYIHHVTGLEVLKWVEKNWNLQYFLLLVASPLDSYLFNSCLSKDMGSQLSPKLTYTTINTIIPKWSSSARPLTLTGHVSRFPHNFSFLIKHTPRL